MEMLSKSRAAGWSSLNVDLYPILTYFSHILQEMTVSSYVPNNTLLMGGTEQSEDNLQDSARSPNPSMLLLTGPNYSGKSVYMKQVSAFKQADQVSLSKIPRLLS